MGPVVGGVVGGLAVVGLVGAAAFFYLRRRQAGPAGRAGRHDAILDPGAEKYGTYGGEPAPGSPGFVPGMTGGYGAESRPMLYVRSISCLRPALLGGALRAVRTEPERPADVPVVRRARPLVPGRERVVWWPGTVALRRLRPGVRRRAIWHGAAVVVVPSIRDVHVANGIRW